MRTKAIIAMLALALGSIRAGEPSSKDRFAKLLSEAKANLETSAGRSYDQALSAHLESKMGPVMQGCFETTKSPDASAFGIVLILSKDGTSRDVAVWPETNISLCFKNKLISKPFPAPPADGYLAYVDMKFEP